MNVKEKLKELGINSANTYPKKSFLHRDVPVITLFKSELIEEFYFFNDYNKILYKVPILDIENLEKDQYNNKYIVPLSLCEELWKDEPYVELPDIPFSNMTVRQYACIKLRIPKSGVLWLDELIKESNNG